MDSRSPNHSPFMHIYHKLLHIGSHGSHGSAEGRWGHEMPGAPWVLQGLWLKNSQGHTPAD